MHQFLKYILGMKLYMLRTVPLSITTSSSLYTQQWYMSDRFADSLRAGSGWNWVPSWSFSQAVNKPVWHIPLLCVQWRTRDDGQRNCPKQVVFYSKNKSEKSVHLVGFIIRRLFLSVGTITTGVTRWYGWLRHCATSQKVAGSFPNGVTGIFHRHNPAGRTMALGFTQPLMKIFAQLGAKTVTQS